jgi:hypothetical protein
MSGLEVVALVVGIVSAFSGTASFLSELKKRKTKTKTRNKPEDLDKLRDAVKLAPPQIQQEYDQDFARIGPEFAAGDCKFTILAFAIAAALLNIQKTAIGKAELTSILINMQQNMIAKLQALLLSTSSNPIIDYTSLFGISDRSKLDCISALAQQYQRFSTAAPIPRNAQSLPQPTDNTPGYCPGALELQRGTSRISINWRCSACEHTMLPWDPRPPGGKPKPRNPPEWATGCKGMSYVFSYAQHLLTNPVDRSSTGRLLVYRRCIICWEKGGVVSKKMTKEEWLVHVNEHFTSGGYQMCKNADGMQQRKRKCTVQGCEKIHTVG